MNEAMSMWLRWTGKLLVASALGFLLPTTYGPAAAQGEPGSVSCYAADASAASEARICRAHRGCDILLSFQERRAACPDVREFLARVGAARAGRAAITSNDVFDAAAPALTNSEALKFHIAAVQKLVADALGKPGIARQDEQKQGVKVYYEGGIRDGQFHGVGVLIVDNGSMMRGEFQNGRLSGLGQMQNLGSLSLSAGGFQDFLLNGNGAMQTSDGVVHAGRFNKARLTGLVEETDARGYTRKTLHDDTGRILARGEQAAPGQIARAPAMAALSSDKLPTLEFIKDCSRKYFAAGWNNLKLPSENWNGAAMARSARAIRELYEGPCANMSDAKEKLAEAAQLAHEAEKAARIEAASEAKDRAEAAQAALAILGVVAGAVVEHRQARRAASSAPATPSSSYTPASGDVVESGGQDGSTGGAESRPIQDDGAHAQQPSIASPESAGPDRPTQRSSQSTQRASRPTAPKPAAEKPAPRQKRQHVPEAIAHDCLNPKPGGGVRNACPFAVEYSYCVYRPKPSTYSESFDCERRSLGSWQVGANSDSIMHSSGQQVFYFACKYGVSLNNPDGISPRDVRFVSPRTGLEGRCAEWGAG